MARKDAENKTVVLKIRRYSPETDLPTHWSTYKLNAGRYDRVLDLLIRVKAEHDGTLTFRSSCGHGVCGSCAMRINGRNRLACKALAWSLGRLVTVEPLPGLTVLKDLVVDMDPLYAAHKAILPYVAPVKQLPQREQVVLPLEQARYVETARCILCAACVSACPLYRIDGGQLGSAALVQAHRFIFDSRDRLALERLNIINTRNGVWRCRTAYSCTDACPQGIPVTQAIHELKREIASMALRQTTGQLRQEDCPTNLAPYSPEQTP